MIVRRCSQRSQLLQQLQWPPLTRSFVNNLCSSMNCAGRVDLGDSRGALRIPGGFVTAGTPRFLRRVLEMNSAEAGVR
ncbi:MAG TPA: hypothetical protein DEW39_11095 [Brevibacterium sp.]|nr:hypothetical protein [Brevibacterium sp.]